MNREILEKPFSPEQIKQREGNFGKKLDYIEGHAVIQRLNDAFDADWSFTITKHDILKETDEVIVIGQLNAGGIVKSQFGSSRITRARETGEIISLADDLKAAATDALKKAATLLGVGLHLYRNDRTQAGHRQTGGQRNNGYRSLQELDIVIDLTDTDALTAIKNAQLEQALHEIRHDLDDLQASQVALGGLINIKLDRSNGEKPSRYSQRTLAILKPYLRAPVISRIR